VLQGKKLSPTSTTVFTVTCGLSVRTQEGASWQASLRALCALEAIVQQGSSAACGKAAVYFQVRIRGSV